jgi:hypothetical protein
VTTLFDINPLYGFFNRKELSMTIHILGRTGPKSLPGKYRSSLNALKHGGYAKTKILPFEDEAEYNRLRKDIYKALQPGDIIQKNLANQIVDSLWRIERLELKFSFRVDEKIGELKPNMLAAMIDADERFVPFAPDYLLNPNHKIAKKDVQDAGIVIYQYEQFLKNAKGMNNYNGVWRQYPELFKRAHIWAQDEVSIPFFMSHGNDLNIEWQNNPELVLKLLHKFAAHMYFRAKFNDYKSKIRVMMASWLFLQKQELRNSDHYDDFIMKECRIYQSLLDSFVKLRKSQDGHLMFLHRLKIKPEIVVLQDFDGNEMPKSDL